MMNYLFFSLAFMGLHTFAYMGAGMVAFNISSDLYQGKGRILDFLVDPEEEGGSGSTLKKVIPAQIVRGLIMSVVLYPILGFLGEISFLAQFLFFGGLTFIYTDLSSADPFPSNLEGLVYMKKRLLEQEGVLEDPYRNDNLQRDFRSPSGLVSGLTFRDICRIFLTHSSDFIARILSRLILGASSHAPESLPFDLSLERGSSSCWRGGTVQFIVIRVKKDLKW